MDDRIFYDGIMGIIIHVIKNKNNILELESIINIKIRIKIYKYYNIV